MTFKTLLTRVSLVIGLTVSAVTALATYLIIDTPIGWKMTLQILLTVAGMAPLIYLLSRLFGGYVSGIFKGIEERLERIGRHDYAPQPSDSKIAEIAHTQEVIAEMATTLSASIEKLQVQNREKEQMLLSIAHDFRTPLTVMRGYIEEIEDGLIPVDRLEPTMQILQKEIAFLSDLITNIVLYLESYKTPSCREEIVLKEFLEQEVVPLLPQKETVSIIIDVDEKCRVWFDPLSLQRVFFNLFSNAYKFTASGEIRVVQQGEKIYFRDSGTGIDSGEEEKIFQPFYTVDSSRNQEQSGMGLGLSIVQNLLQQNGYTIQVEREYRSGAGFLIEALSESEGEGEGEL